jgi:hypothetical protein
MMVVVPTIAETYYVCDPAVGAAISGFVIAISMPMS